MFRDVLNPLAVITCRDTLHLKPGRNGTRLSEYPGSLFTFLEKLLDNNKKILNLQKPIDLVTFMQVFTSTRRQIPI